MFGCVSGQIRRFSAVRVNHLLRRRRLRLRCLRLPRLRLQRQRRQCVYTKPWFSLQSRVFKPVSPCPLFSRSSLTALLRTCAVKAHTTARLCFWSPNLCNNKWFRVLASLRKSKISDRRSQISDRRSQRVEILTPVLSNLTVYRSKLNDTSQTVELLAGPV